MRAACQYFRLHRSTYAYRAKHPDAWLMKLKAAVRRLSRQYARWGYPKITKLLKDEGWNVVGKRLVQRLRRELGLAIPLRKPRRRRRGVSTGLPTKAEQPGHVWTWDFIHDKTVRGGSLKILTVLDEYTRECPVIHVDRHINAQTVRGIMQKVIDRNGPPQYIRSDNGSEFIESELRTWLTAMKIKTLYIEPGSPWQNGYIESFHARFREECLNREQLWTLTEARVVIEDWRWLYNNVRPHRSLGNITPRDFAEDINTEGSGSIRATPSFHPSLDFLYQLNFNINLSRLTLPVDQFA